jgi:hypothetical protein
VAQVVVEVAGEEEATVVQTQPLPDKFFIMVLLK